jgi:hypothetical protein
MQSKDPSTRRTTCTSCLMWRGVDSCAREARCAINPGLRASMRGLVDTPRETAAGIAGIDTVRNVWELLRKTEGSAATGHRSQSASGETQKLSRKA